MFPGPGAQVYYNDAGEPLGWDYPSEDPMDYYCHDCGGCHAGACPMDDDVDTWEDE